MKDATEIVVILDRSEPMQDMQQEAIGGFNAFLADQKAIPGEARLTLVLFDHRYDVIHASVPLADVPALNHDTYQTTGTTALLDAVGRTVVAVGTRLEALAEEDRPNKVMVTILTAGMGNASREYRQEQIAAMLKEQQEKYRWEVIFLAANIDAYAAGGQLGIKDRNIRAYADSGDLTQRGFRGMSAITTAYRTSR
uniref:Putative von Willebrand domain containing protein n=1 Tax=viral metagenome TaxID=1070528 RepID=A0A6H1ZBS0_9ZZZZ